MIKKIIILLLLTATVAACQTTKVVTETKTVFISPPQTLINCPQIKKSDVPNSSTATNQQVVNFINLLVKYNKICGINMTQINKYIIDYKRAFIQ